MTPPTEAVTILASIPDTFAIVMVGIPTGPNGTGTVLPTKQIIAAGKTGKPRPISMAAAIATGAPWAVVPSRNAEKQKPIRIA